ncbi:MAG TPA: hypothetical protein VMU83_03330 [Hanamia sp.]|nr:hypothetical protein [Hanamia sp.]
MPLNYDMQLIKQLKELGFDSITDEVNSNINAGYKNFTVIQSNKIDDDSLLYVLQFKTTENKVILAGYGLTMQTIVIPKVLVKGIDTAELEARMIKADDSYNEYYMSGKAITNEDTKIIESGNRDLNSLFEAGGIGREVSQLLMFKYWPENNYREFIPDVESLKRNYQVELQVAPNRGKLLTPEEAYKEAKEFYHVKKIKGMDEEHVISDSLFEQAKFELSFNRNWLAYNSVNYFLDKGDVYFFKHKEEAIEFSGNNISEYDDYKIIYANSIHDFIKQIPYGKEMSDITTAYLAKDTNQQSIFNSQLKTNIMNKENFQYLSDNLKYMGFGENLKTDLEKNLNEGKEDFQLHYKAEINKKPFEVTMNFRKSDTSDMYFFNNYHASLEKSKGEKVEQTFYFNKGKGITGKEAFNLLDGRSVHKDLITKEGQPYKAWMQLDFENKGKNNNFEVKQFHEKYGFDLKAAVEKFPITDLKEPDKEKALMQSLQKGNIQSVTIEKDGSNNKMFIEADPQFKKVNLYDSNMKLVTKESLEIYQSARKTEASMAVKEEMGNDKKKELKQEPKSEKEKVEKKNDKTLLPKKRERSKKGLGVA